MNKIHLTSRYGKHSYRLDALYLHWAGLTQVASMNDWSDEWMAKVNAAAARYDEFKAQVEASFQVEKDARRAFADIRPRTKRLVAIGNETGVTDYDEALLEEHRRNEADFLMGTR